MADGTVADSSVVVADTPKTEPIYSPLLCVLSRWYVVLHHNTPNGESQDTDLRQLLQLEIKLRNLKDYTLRELLIPNFTLTLMDRSSLRGSLAKTQCMNIM
jgi:hypothetical protein